MLKTVELSIVLLKFSASLKDNPLVPMGESIASEGKGQYLLVTGRVLDTSGKPVPNATIETWETDEFGFYDTQYVNRDKPDCRGRLKTDQDGRYEYRAIVPVAYPIPGDVNLKLYP